MTSCCSRLLWLTRTIMLQNSLQSELTTGKFYPVDCLMMQPMVLEETPLPHVEDFVKPRTPDTGIPLAFIVSKYQ